MKRFLIEMSDFDNRNEVILIIVMKRLSLHFTGRIRRSIMSQRSGMVKGLAARD